MFKNNKKRFLPAVLLILLSCLLLLPFSVYADSTGTETRTLTVDFELDQCSVEVWIYNNSSEPEQKIALESGKPKEILFGQRNVEVKVIPSPGYELDAIYKINGDGVKEGPWTEWSTSQFNNDVRLDIDCKKKTFSVKFVEEDGEPIKTYEFPSDVAEKYKNLQYTYQNTVVIDPVVKTSRGYTFKSWEMVYREGEVLIAKPLPKDSEGNWILSSGVMIQDEWQKNGEIYLRPVFSPNSYPVWWYDREVLIPGDYDSSSLLTEEPYQTVAPMGSDIDGTVNTDIYPGYVFDMFISYPVTEDDSEGGIAMKNKVYRYFNPISYTVKYEYANGVLTPPSGTSIADKHVFNKDTVLPSATRQGYTFEGWEVLVNGKVVETIPSSDVMCLKKRTQAYALENFENTLTLRAIWTPNEYAIEYDLGGADASVNASLPTVYTYNSALKIPTPVRKGYQFLGWVLGGDDSKIIPALTLEAETYLDTVHLRAVWQAKTFEVVLDSNGGLPTTGSVLPNKVAFDQALNTTGITLPKRSQYKLLGFYYEDTLYINPDGSAACEKWDLDTDLSTGRITLTAKWELLPVTEVDPGAYGIDYKNEKFQFPAGSYKVTFGDITVEFTVDADGMGGGKIPDEFFGNTVQLTVCTPNDALYSDYHGSLTIVARPDAPTRENNIIDQVFSTNTTIQVLFKSGIDVSLYETSLYLDGKSVVAWGDTLVFENLKEGTSYVVLVRVKATDDTPASISTRFDRDTDSKGFKESLRKELDKLIQPGDGEMVQTLISNAKNQIDELKHSPTFYEDAQRIVTDAAEAVKFARRQDQRITDLRSYRDALLATKAYNQSNQALIEALYADAEAKIGAATDDATVQEAYEYAYKAMSAVKISYLRNDEMFMTSEDGLPKDYTVTLVRHPDFATQAEQVNSAITAGKVFGFGGNSPADLIKLLKTQDVMAAYTMSLSGTEYTGIFKVTLHLPEELRGVSGLRVAYYDKTTGALEVLETETEGDYLVFYAESIADFVILGDPVLNLIVPVIALFVVVICQLIAVFLILKGRSESKKAVRNYSFAMPLFLTIQFLPKHGEWMVLILGALVILLQIVLTVLLLKSEVIHKSRLKRGAYEMPDEPSPAASEAQEAYADATSYRVTESLEENAPEAEYAQTEDEETFYYASVNTENDFEETEGEFAETTTYSLDENTGELYEDPAGEYTDVSFGSEFLYEDAAETSVAENDDPVTENDAYAASEDAETEAPLFLFDDEDVVYGDPAEPPYEDDAVQDEPEETEITDTYQ